MSVDGGDKGSWGAEHLPQGWEWVSFNEFWTDHTDSKRKIPQKSYLAEGALPVIDQGASLIGGYANDSTKKSLAPLPTIVFGDHTRAIKYVDHPFVQGADGVRILCAAQGVDPLFAYHALRCVQLPDKGYSRHFRFLKATQFPLAPPLEQHRIVAKIDSLSAKSQRAKERFDHIPRLVDKYKQAILTAAFRGELTREWRRLHSDVASAERLLVRIRDLQRAKWEEARRTPFEPHFPITARDEIFEIPPSWCWTAAEEIVEPGADIVYGIVQPGPKLASGVPYVRGTDIEDGQIKIDQLLFTSKEIAEKYSRASLRGGDILLGIIRATKVAVVPKSLEGANITQGTARFRPSSMIKTAFLARWLESPDAQTWLHSKYRGIDMPGLNLRDVRRLPVPLAPLDEQEEVVRLIGTAFVWIDRLASETTRARKLIDHLDQAILAKAFRGELVPPDPNDEPASVLLERIRAEREVKSSAKRPKKK